MIPNTLPTPAKKSHGLIASAIALKIGKHCVLATFPDELYSVELYAYQKPKESNTISTHTIVFSRP